MTKLLYTIDGYFTFNVIYYVAAADDYDKLHMHIYAYVVGRHCSEVEATLWQLICPTHKALLMSPTGYRYCRTVHVETSTSPSHHHSFFPDARCDVNHCCRTQPQSPRQLLTAIPYQRKPGRVTLCIRKLKMILQRTLELLFLSNRILTTLSH